MPMRMANFISADSRLHSMFAGAGLFLRSVEISRALEARACSVWVPSRHFREDRRNLPDALEPTRDVAPDYSSRPHRLLPKRLIHRLLGHVALPRDHRAIIRHRGLVSSHPGAVRQNRRLDMMTSLFLFCPPVTRSDACRKLTSEPLSKIRSV